MTSAGRAWARFDDLRTGVALQCPSPHRIVTAHRPDEVAGALAEVEHATDAGDWAFGYVGYEAAAGLDPHLAVHAPPAGGPPLLWFGLCAEPTATSALVPSPDPGAYTSRWEPGWTPAEHRRGVEQVRSRIAAGETYQCNLTVRMRGRVSGDLVQLYGDLAQSQRGAHNAYLDLGRFVIASASPELFFERTGDTLLLRPMKGTATRGRYLSEDEDRAHRLRSSAKERAENVMIVDLLRNDAARIATTGGVRVPALLQVERYETVLQLTSDVTARLRPGTGLLDVFRALFPSGSVTGAPKTSTMALIRELEPTPRGVYCGAIGLVGPPGAAVRARFNVAIRTVVVDRSTGAACYGTGGGITWGSDPAAEHAEVLAKTAILGRRHQEFELLETMYHDPATGLRGGERHLRRMADSARHLGFRFDRAAAAADLDARLRGVGAARVRLRLHRDGTTAVDVSEPPPPSSDPVVLAVDDEPVDSAQRLLFHKTSLREPYRRRLERHPGVADVVLVNERGEVTETTIANLAVRLDGRWWTPALGSGCLPGVERARLLELDVLRERVLHVPDLHRAEALAVISSLRGWRSARLRADGDGDGDG